jgi:hypothetical protein
MNPRTPDKLVNMIQDMQAAYGIMLDGITPRYSATGDGLGLYSTEPLQISIV